MKTRKTITVGALFFASSLFAGSAHAAHISGDISFNGSWAPIIANGDVSTIAAATGIDFLPGVTVSGSPAATGDFATGTSSGEAVAFTDFQFATLPVLSLWSVGGFTFDLTSVTTVTKVPEVFLGVTGIGVVDFGGDKTSGTWTFSGNTAGATFGFSSSSTAPVPDAGASLALLGIGLAFLAAAGRGNLLRRR